VSIKAGNNKTLQLLISKDGFNVNYINFRKAIPVETFHITQDTLVLLKNGTANVNLELLPANTTRPGVTWTSANTSLATVDALGKVTAKNVLGLTYIYAKSADGIHKDTCVVKVITINTGLSEPLQNNSFLQVYPNPYKHGELTIKMNRQGNHVITIVDITGKIVYKAQSLSSEVNIGHLALNKGIYIVKVASNKHIDNAKLIVK